MQISKHRKILLPTRMLKLARMTPNVGEDGEQTEQVYTTGRARVIQPTGTTDSIYQRQKYAYPVAQQFHS